MTRFRHAFWAVLLAGVACHGTAEEIDFVEQFALADDRPEVLQRLVPGSEDYYYYHCLHYQNTGQYQQVDQLLKIWQERYKNSPRLRQMQTRQALLTYQLDKAKTLEFLQKRLNLRFDHQPPKTTTRPDLPDRLDPKLIQRDSMTKQAMARHTNLAGFTDHAFDWLIAMPLDAARRRHLLERLRRPDYDGLPELIVQDLKSPRAKPFGSLSVHKMLLRAQLDRLVELMPELAQQAAFIQIYLTKLVPGSDTDWRADWREREAYLQRLEDFVTPLGPAHNSLKAHVLYHRLAHDRSRGTYDKDRFLAYVKLPRQAAYVEPRFLESGANRRYVADLKAAFDGATQLPPVGNDEPLVRAYLLHFLRDETSTKPYEPFLRSDYLKPLLAEAKLTTGQGDPEQWFSLLSPAQYQALKDRVDLEFAPTNPEYFTAGDPVKLDLYIKNVPQLIVKVFKINAANYYRQTQREVETNIELDGLVANHEQTYSYEDAPIRRVRRTFEFPMLDEPGVYVVEWIGNGVSSRAVVRKARLRFTHHMTAAGHLFQVFDEQHRPLKDATAWVGGHEYSGDDDGRIVVPFSTRPGRRAVVFQRGELATLAFFHHAPEAYALAAGIYVDRESLLPHRTAQIVIRPRLTVNSIPAPLKLLEDVHLKLTATDHDGITTTRDVADFALPADREAVYSFQVPPRLHSLTVELSGRVDSLSEGKPVELTTQRTFVLNGIDHTSRIGQLHLMRNEQQYVLELRGRTGEVEAHRAVQLTLTHRDFADPVRLTLQTNEQGRIALGTLPGITSLKAETTEKTVRIWNLKPDRYAYPDTLHGVAGEALQIPYMGSQTAPSRGELSLLEIRGRTFAQDRFESLQIKDGFLTITGLPAGDYDLWLKSPDRHIHVRLAAGSRRGDRLLGASRDLDLAADAPLQIASVQRDTESLKIQLRNAGDRARVHVVATRYQPAYDVFAFLESPAVPLSVAPYLRPVTRYVAGRNIGDEYRYIIERKYAAKYPGNMLTRPELLLNPWAVRSTETGEQKAAAGEAYGGKAEKTAESPPVPKRAAAQKAQEGDDANLDFLARPSTVLVNLQPDESGVISVPLDKLGDHSLVHVVAIDQNHTACRTVALAEKPLEPRDLRLAESLPAKDHFAQQKKITVVPSGESFRLPGGDSRVEIYDRLGQVFKLYRTLCNDSKLDEFAPIAQWPELSDEEKRAFYSKRACHELHFFLLHKDPEFFESVVRPYLANKRDRTFLDDWLLGESLDAYLTPWRYERLNVVERILLARRLREQQSILERELSEQFELLPRDEDYLNRLFVTALAGRALEATSLSRRRAMLGRELTEEDMPAPAAEPAFGLAAPADRMRAASRAEEAKRVDMESLAEQRKTIAELEMLDSQMLALRGRMRRLYRAVDQTQEWAENNYDRLPLEQQTAELVTLNAFWLDYARYSGDQPFLSPHLAEASRNFTEVMLALAVLDLPFEAGKHEQQETDETIIIKAASPMAVYHRQIQSLKPSDKALPILVSQNFFRVDDRYVIEEGQKRDKFVTDEFLTQIPYGCRVVVTNPASAPQKVSVLLQIPQGSVPLQRTRFTGSVDLDLEPYHTETLEYFFYFPAPGSFSHYPVQVSQGDSFLAAAEPMSFRVVDEPTSIDKSSWQYVSQHGTNDDVIAFLKERSLRQIDLELIAFRMADPKFFRQVIDILRENHVYHPTLWSYGVRHGDEQAIREFLDHQDEIVAECGPRLDSPLLVVDPIVRGTYEHLEYRPLINARAHRLGKERQILNDRLWQQYHRLMGILSCQKELSDRDRLEVAYYLLLQDRVHEAIDQFQRIERDRLHEQLQYDYCSAYLAMYRADLDEVRRVVRQYQEHPVDRWRKAFEQMADQLEEITRGRSSTGRSGEDEPSQGQLAATEPALDVALEGKNVHVTYQNVDRIRVNYYLMDIELLFSRNPFVQRYSEQFAFVQPNRWEEREVSKRSRSVSFPIPEDLVNRNVLVEVKGGGQVRSQAYYSNSLAVTVIEPYGQLRVVEAESGRPAGKVYVKVYGRMKDGSVSFYKDGYTDLRGKFDYASLSTNRLDAVDRFAILILSDELGAVVREASPPQQ